MPFLFILNFLGAWLLAAGITLLAQSQKQPTAAELSKTETPGKALMRNLRIARVRVPLGG